MNDNQYALAGWLAIAAAVLLLPSAVLSILLEIPKPGIGVLLPVYIPVAITQVAFALYALWKLRLLLNERFQFHDVDGLIPIIIAGVAAITCIGLTGKIAMTLGLISLPGAIAFIALIGVVGIPLSILNIVFAIKLLRLEDGLYGLLKPFVYTALAASICFATLLLAPLGMLIDAANSIILGIIFLRAAQGAPEVEFV